MIPLVWDTDEIAGNERYWWYPGDGYVPYAAFGGTIFPDENDFSTYEEAYQQIFNADSPLEMSVSMGMVENQLFVTTDIQVFEPVTTANNKLFFVLSKLVPDYDADYVNKVIAYSGEFDFTLTEIGETMSFDHYFELDPGWNLEELSAVAIVQSWIGSKDILQSAACSLAGLTPQFETNIQSGPPNLVVHFNDSSFSPNGIAYWEWDLDGDGIIDSNEQNPSFIYYETGFYDVTLRIYDGVETAEITSIDHINVTDPAEISGELSCIWTTEHSPYIITDDVVVSQENMLIIDPGVEIYVNNDSRFYVYGGMTAGAYDSDPIIFTSENQWKGLSFESTQESNILDNCWITKANKCAVLISQSAVEIINCRIFENSGSSFATALEVINTDDVLIRNTVISNNINNGTGGVIGFLESNPAVTNNIIVNNTAISNGIVMCESSDINFVNNTFAHNSADAGIIHLRNCNPGFKNSIIAENNQVFYLDNSAPIVVYSLVSGGYAGLGNIDEDPMFSAPSEGNGSEFDGLEADWYLLENSLCIDAGHPSETYFDNEDPDNPGYALFPAMGFLRNDMGAFGGDGFIDYVGVENYDEIMETFSPNSLKVFPNPFQSSITISYELSAKNVKNVNISIYNIKGQKIKTFSSQQIRRIPEKQIIWNGKDESGKPVFSGIYFIKSDNDPNIAVRKILLKK